jgi:hypothetical protein
LDPPKKYVPSLEPVVELVVELIAPVVESIAPVVESNALVVEFMTTMKFSTNNIEVIKILKD